MMHKKHGIAKGLGLGMVAGLVVGASVTGMMQNNKNFKRTTSKAMRAVSDFVGNVQYMMK